MKTISREVLAPIGDDEPYWENESNGVFKIINIADYDSSLEPYELRERAHELGYQRMLKDADYFGYFYRVSRIDAVGCPHKISGCAYWCSDARGFYVCDKCAPKPICKSNRVRCLFCGFDQRFAQKCRRCKQLFGNYSCTRCQLNIHEPVFLHPFTHCIECNVCHPMNYKYCQKCHECFADLFHSCGLELQCPVCLSQICDNQVDGKCGHSVCYKCYRLKLHEKDVKCAICRRTFLLEQDFDYMRSALREDNFNFNYDDVVLRCQCNDCSITFFEQAQRWQYCRHCNFFNVDVLHNYQDQNVEVDFLFEPTIRGMKEFLLENYGNEMRRRCLFSGGNNMLLASRIYDFLGINADAESAANLARTARFGMSLEELKIRLKTHFRSKRSSKL